MLSAGLPKYPHPDRGTADGGTRLQAILDAIADAVVTIDRSGRILQWNAGAERTFGYRREEVVGCDVTMLMPEPFRSRHGRFFIATLVGSRENAIGHDLTAQGKDGTIFPIELTVNEARDEDEIFYTGVIRDITERRRAEAELVAARKQAEDANRAKSQFLATMSHEIRTPMNGVLGMANLLSLTPLNGRQGRLVENLLRSGQALLGIINDILDFSKIEAGRLDLFEVDFDLRETVAEIADLFGERCSAKGLEFVYFVAEDVPSHLRGDPVRLRQILINLVGNAIKFTERGEILIEVMISGMTAEELVVDFTVEDTGIGIAPEQRARVFEFFHQVDGSMTRSRGGSGLGLAITRQLVELMGGRIGVESELGRGSRFRFSGRFGRSASDTDAERAARHLTRPLRVLLVDANAISAHVMTLYMTGWKLGVIPAASAEEAMEAWGRAEKAAQPFDVVLIDVKGLGRDAAADLARKLGGGPARLILMLGMDKTVADQSLDALGAFATLTKPVRPSELFNCLSAIASGAREHGIEPFFVRRNARAERLKYDARVLVVEDNIVNQEVALGMLEALGCKVVTAPNGRAGVQRFAQEKFDVVLMDCEMPLMNGFDATRRIREMETLAAQLPGSRGQVKRTPIIALTAHALGEVRERCKTAGMDDFLVKPFDGLQLSEALRRWLDPAGVFAVEAVPELPPAVLPEAPPAIEMAAINEIRKMGGTAGHALLGRVVGQFLSTAGASAALIRERLQAGDAEAAWRAAHSLKSSSGTLGARRLAACCGELETTARDAGAYAAKPMLAPLEAELATAMAALRQIVAPGAAS